VVLVDTSVWVDHFRRACPSLMEILTRGEVLCHAAVVGELACGQMRRRATTLALLRALPRAATAHEDEVLAMIEHHHLHGAGLGWVDAHLLASARLSACQLWTLDKPLARAARLLGVGHPH
jgi:predicted nucleic acid-binding protein